MNSHLSNMRFSYVLHQAREEEVPRYNGHMFIAIDYGQLPDDVKARMPLKPGRVCMKFLLSHW